MLLLGLTGSIGMGKSVTAAMFAAEGVPTHDADRAVHDLYAGAAVAPVEAAFPGVSVAGVIDRGRLAAALLSDPEGFQRLEAIVHPLVQDAEARFIAAARIRAAAVVVLDIPLLLESGAQDRVDVVVVVSASGALQRERVLARPGMTEAKLDALLARQMPDIEKRRHAHFVVDTGRGFDSARAQVRGILRAVAAIPGPPR
jgi:dephospho-CoA kinase